MKNLRQILLDRYQAAQPQLDAVRTRVLDGFAPPPCLRVPWWQAGWQEIFYSARHAWGGLAALGVLGLGLNVTLPRPDRPLPLPPIPPAAVAAEGWRARAQLLADLAGEPATEATAHDPTPPTTPANQPNPSPPGPPGRQRSALEGAMKAVA